VFPYPRRVSVLDDSPREPVGPCLRQSNLDGVSPFLLPDSTRTRHVFGRDDRDERAVLVRDEYLEEWNVRLAGRRRRPITRTLQSQTARDQRRRGDGRDQQLSPSHVTCRRFRRSSNCGRPSADRLRTRRGRARSLTGGRVASECFDARPSGALETK